MRATASIALIGGAAHAAAQSPPAASPDAARLAHRQRMAQIRLDRLAQRLEIRASQQNAWQAYARTVTSMDPARKRPERSEVARSDAATIIRLRAERASRRAQGLTRLADATAKLAMALDPIQRQLLDDVARRGQMAAPARGARSWRDGMQRRRSADGGQPGLV
jgi:dTDP-4-amino-4,6-dideoxygalactose transaminase